MGSRDCPLGLLTLWGEGGHPRNFHEQFKKISEDFPKIQLFMGHMLFKKPTHFEIDRYSRDRISASVDEIIQPLMGVTGRLAPFRTATLTGGDEAGYPRNFHGSVRTQFMAFLQSPKNNTHNNIKQPISMIIR